MTQLGIKALHNTKHFKTETDVMKLGLSGAEVTFLGRSNVGKSSLINALCRKRNMAHSSQIPGKTRTINVYEVIPGRWMVDLPGYGFAVGGTAAREELGSVIESYLKDREKLAMVYLVMDAVAGPTKLDMTMLTWLKHHAYPVTFVVHKIDKISPSKLEVRKKEIAGMLECDRQLIYWVSSSKTIGIDQLQKSIIEHLRL